MKPIIITLVVTVLTICSVDSDNRHPHRSPSALDWLYREGEIAIHRVRNVLITLGPDAHQSVVHQIGIEISAVEHLLKQLKINKKIGHVFPFS